MDLGPLLLIGFMWLVVNALRKAGSGPTGGKSPPERPRASPPRNPRLPGSRLPGGRATGAAPDAGRTLPPGVDATQREGARLEALLRDLGRALDQTATGPRGRAPDRPLPAAPDEEETESLESQPDVRSLEDLTSRPERAVVDQDDQAERLVAERLEAARANSAPRTRADHRAFDVRIRQEVADKTATRGFTARQLRDAVVWREILGPPVSLRQEDE